VIFGDGYTGSERVSIYESFRLDGEGARESSGHCHAELEGREGVEPRAGAFSLFVYVLGYDWGPLRSHRGGYTYVGASADR
jgi:hypothetical protein